MPYKIKKVKGGYKVAEGKKVFSKKPLTKTMAKKQQIAIAISEHKMTGKPVSYFFG